MTNFHPDWPTYDDTIDEKWELPTPLDDLAYALETPASSADQIGATVVTISLADVATVENYYVKYHDSPWVPGNGDAYSGFGGTELEMVLIGTLKDGRWFSINAWNDYTGWGCQDASVVRIASSREQIIANGLDNEGRTALGLAL